MQVQKDIFRIPLIRFLYDSIRLVAILLYCWPLRRFVYLHFKYIRLLYDIQVDIWAIADFTTFRFPSRCCCCFFSFFRSNFSVRFCCFFFIILIPFFGSFMRMTLFDKPNEIDGLSQREEKTYSKMCADGFCLWYCYCY